MRTRRVLLVIAIAVLAHPGGHAVEAQDPRPGGRGDIVQGGRGGAGRGDLQRPARDQNRAADAIGTGVIAGSVVAADSGRPVKRARVIAVGGGRPRATTTDEQGRYRITALPPGTYTLTAAKTGFVDAAYGQRRALRTGTPIQIAEGQQVGGANIRLSRGGVITGHIVDEDGEPLARAPVSVMRYQYVGGEKRLAPAGGDQSDDRGQYRVFGLPPGDYFVSATAGGLDRITARLLNTGGENDGDSTGYAPTYYPGVTSVGDAMRLKLATAQELTGIDFQLQLVPLATVHGTVAGGNGMAVVLLPDDGISSRQGQNFRAAVRQDGTFSIPGVPPGRYSAMARGDGLSAIQPLVVSGEDVTISLAPGPGVDASGTVTLEASGTSLPKGLSGFRLVPLPLDVGLALGRAGRGTDIGEDGRFAIKGLMPGRYSLRAAGPRGWMMKSVYLNGRDVTDQPLDIRQESVSDLNVIFTDRIGSVSGTVRDARGTGIPATTVIVFPADSKLWVAQSRLIQTARTDQAGAYLVSSLPAGEYFVVATDDVEQGEWFDPAFLDQVKEGAVRVTLSESEQRTQDLKAS